MVFILYPKRKRAVWTEYIKKESVLEHISMKRVLQVLNSEERKELIENWNILKGETPKTT